jgi:hypothetical protein
LSPDVPKFGIDAPQPGSTVEEVFVRIGGQLLF